MRRPERQVAELEPIYHTTGVVVIAPGVPVWLPGGCFSTIFSRVTRCQYITIDYGTCHSPQCPSIRHQSRYDANERHWP